MQIAIFIQLGKSPGMGPKANASEHRARTGRGPAATANTFTYANQEVTAAPSPLPDTWPSGRPVPIPVSVWSLENTLTDTQIPLGFQSLLKL